MEHFLKNTNADRDNNFVCSICAPQSIIYAYLGEFHSAKNRARVLLIGNVIVF